MPTCEVHGCSAPAHHDYCDDHLLAFMGLILADPEARLRWVVQAPTACPDLFMTPSPIADADPCAWEPDPLRAYFYRTEAQALGAAEKYNARPLAGEDAPDGLRHRFASAVFVTRIEVADGRITAMESGRWAAVPLHAGCCQGAGYTRPHCPRHNAMGAKAGA